jgi:hypothetical protein
MNTPTIGSSESNSDALAVLTKFHSKVLDWFEDYNAAGSNVRKQELASIICRGLQVHIELEQKVFLPALFQMAHDSAVCDAAASDHALIRQLTRQVLESSPIDELFDSKVRILGDAFARRVAALVIQH